MNFQSLPIAQTHELPADAPVVLPLALLDQVAGGLPYHGFSTAPAGGESASTSPASDLPYHGF